MLKSSCLEPQTVILFTNRVIAVVTVEVEMNSTGVGWAVIVYKKEIGVMDL